MSTDTPTTQPVLGTTPAGRQLPIPAELAADLEAAIRQLCVQAASRLSGIDMDPATATLPDAQQWLTAQLTVAETLSLILAEHQPQLMRLARRLGVTDRRMAEALGMTEQGAARRRQRATQQT